jgi:Family of unknown function (DUF6411)
VLIAGIVGVCLLLFVLARRAPRLSIWPQLGVDQTLEQGQRAGSEAPGEAGRRLAKPFGSSRKAANKSASAGRKSRWHLPF